MSLVDRSFEHETSDLRATGLKLSPVRALAPGATRILVEAMFASPHEVVATDANGARWRMTAAHLNEADPNRALWWRIRRHVEVIKPPIRIRVTGYMTGYELEVPSAWSEGSLLITPMPSSALILGERTSPRFIPTQAVTVSLLDPNRPRTRIVGHAVQVGRASVKFVSSQAVSFLRVGTFIPAVRIHWAGEPALELNARVQRVDVGTKDDVHEEYCVLVLDTSGEDGAQWNKLVAKYLHPQCRIGDRKPSYALKLYADSGYLNLSGKSPSEFQHLEEDFHHANVALDAAPELGCRAVWPSNRGVEAAICTLKIYEGTTFLYQLARRRGAGDAERRSGRLMLREVNACALEHAQTDPSFKWILMFVQDAGARWSLLAYHRYGERMVARREGCLFPFRAVEIRCAPEFANTNGFRSALAGEHDKHELLELIRGRRPLAYREALDFEPRRFELEGLRTQWRAKGLTRERECRVIKKNGVTLAAAIFESAENGLHLFGLFDSVRLFALRHNGEYEFPALLDDARRWFSCRGKAGFVYLAEDDAADSPLGSAQRDLGTASFLAIPAHRVADLLEHIYLITSASSAASLAEVSGA